MLEILYLYAQINSLLFYLSFPHYSSTAQHIRPHNKCHSQVTSATWLYLLTQNAKEIINHHTSIKTIMLHTHAWHSIVLQKMGVADVCGLRNYWHNDWNVDIIHIYMNIINLVDWLSLRLTPWSCTESQWLFIGLIIDWNLIWSNSLDHLCYTCRCIEA